MDDFELDVDTAVTPLGEGRYGATITDRWDVGGRPNGGYLLATAARALLAEMPHPDPLTVSAHFLASPPQGPASVDVEVVRRGRTVSTGEARLHSGDRERLRVLATCGDLGALDGPVRVTARPPDLPPRDACVGGQAALPGGVEATIAERFDMRWAPGLPGWANGQPSGAAEVAAWVRFADGRQPDPLALLLVPDALPPTAFELGLFGWVPTIELSVHVRARPVPGWLAVVVRTRVVQGGYLEEDSEVWDAEGTLVAMGRQLARLALPG